MAAGLEKCLQWKQSVGAWKLLIEHSCAIYIVELVVTRMLLRMSKTYTFTIIHIPTYNVVLCLVQKFHARNRWQTPIKATVAQLTCLETNWHLEGMSVSFLLSPITHVTCSFGLRFLSCIEETKITGLRLKHAKCSVSWKWPEAAGALLEVAPQPCETSLSSGCRFMTCFFWM